MAGKNKKRELIGFLERRVWNPTLRASADDYSGADRKRLERMKQKTKTQNERYRSYKSAGQVRQEFQDDLRSGPAKKTNAELEKLDLPRQPDVADEFFELADRLGVTAERGERREHEPHPPHPWHKSKPEDRERAKRKLKKLAREGDKAALQTLREAPRKWARDDAKKLTSRSSGGKKSTKKS